MKEEKELGVQGDTLWFMRGQERGNEMLTEKEGEDGEKNKQETK